MTMTTRNPTLVAECGCPYDPKYDEGHLGWHLTENHIAEAIRSLKNDVSTLAQNLAALVAGDVHRHDHARYP
jgi:hypothetical protein